MSKLPISNDYPPDWPEINARVCAESGHRCIRCGHPYRKGTHGNGEWSRCDDKCTHGLPLSFNPTGDNTELSLKVNAGEMVRRGISVTAQWRILTVHHLDGDKANCAWWNLLALCQRCHLTVQGNVNPQTPYFLEHSDWFKPYVAGFYAHKYEGLNITRKQAETRLTQLLALERLA